MTIFIKTLKYVWTIGFAILILGTTSHIYAQGTQAENDRFELAMRIFNDGQYANAAQEFKQFIINFPTSDRLPDAMLRLGQAHAQAQQYDQALEAFQQFIDRNPNHIEVANAMRSRADALSQLEEYTKAGEAYQAVHSAYSEGEYAVQDLLSAGRNYHKGSALTQAGTAFRRLATQYPKSPLVNEAFYNLGLVYLEESRAEEALDQFRTIVNFSGPTERKPDALLQIGKIALARDNLPEAESVFADLRKRFPEALAAENSYLILANWHANRNDWASAEKTYQKAHLTLPRNTRRQQAVLGSANTKRKLGKSDEALKLYSDFLRVYPQSPFLAHAFLGYGRTFADLGNNRSALEAFKRLQEKFPDANVSIQAFGDIGNIWRKLGTPQKALAAYQTYETRIQAAEEKAKARLHIAQIYEDLKWYDLAAESYRTLIAGEIAQYAAEGQFGLAGVFEKTNQNTLALREYRTYLKNYADGPHAETAETHIQLLTEFANETDRDRSWINLLANLPAVAEDAQTQFVLGKSLYKQKYYSRAITHLEIALKGDAHSWSPEAHYLLGDSYLKQARKAHLQKESPTPWQTKGIEALKTVTEQFADSDWADDAALITIEAETAELQPDTLRAQTRLNAYEAFQKTYANSDRLNDLQLHTADAHLLNNNVATALNIYNTVQKQTQDSAQKEKATYGIGVCQAQQQKHAQAEDTLRNFLFEYPQSDLAPHARFQLGRILLDRGFEASAAEEFSELLAAPSSLELERSSRSLLAESFYRLGNYQRAIEIDEHLLNRDLTPALLRRLARSYFQNNQHDKAVTTYGLFLRKFPDATDADSIAFTRAERLAFLNRTSEAISAFRDIATKYPSSPLRAQADQSVGDLLFQTERYKEAIAVYQRIPKEKRNETMAGRQVMSSYRLRRVKEADKLASQFKKDYKTATNWLALFEVEKGKYELATKNPKKARQRFENVIKKYNEPEAKSEASYYLIRAYYNEGPDKEGKNEPYLDALGSFVRAYPESPHWVKANLELAEFWESSEEYNAAARAYRNALEKGVPQSEKPQILKKLYTSYANLKSYDLAISFARQLIREFPQHTLALDARIDIGTIHLPNKGDHEQAIAELRPLLKLGLREDDKANLQFVIGESYFKMGDYNNARREFLAIRYNQKLRDLWVASAQMKIADCYAALGNIDLAIQELEEIKIRYGATSNYGQGAEDRIQQLKRSGSNPPSFLPGR